MILDGFFCVDKPVGWTSSNVVVKIRNSLGKKYGKMKVGHMGTLDPAGTGVLVIGIGKGTKSFGQLLKSTKVYEAGFVFGVTTDTLDGEGKIVETTGIQPDEASFLTACKQQIGTIMQVPPKYSRINVNGKRAYDLARKGKEFEIEAREINIYSIELLKIEPSAEKPLTAELSNNREFSVRVTCEGGTYVRSLVRDIAKLCGTVGYMSYIRRTRSGIFCIEDSHTVEEIVTSPEDCIMPLSVLN